MKVTKEQANKLLTEIKEVLAKELDYTNFVIVLKKDGLHLSSSAKTNIILGVNVTCNLIESVKMAKENRKLTAYNVAFPNILISYLDKNALTDDNQLTRLCETIVEKAKKIDEFLNLIYTFDISPVIVDSDENLMDAKRVLPSNEYSFGKTNNAFYPVRYSRVSEIVRSYYPKYETLEVIERSIGVDHTISTLLSEKKLSVKTLESLLLETAKQKGRDVLPIAKNLYFCTDSLLNTVYEIRTSLEIVSQMRLLYEHHRKDSENTI